MATFTGVGMAAPAGAGAPGHRLAPQEVPRPPRPVPVPTVPPPGERPGDPPPPAPPPEPVPRPVLALPCTIDLRIFDGQFRPLSVDSLGPPAANLEVTRGAFSVANRNDSDGDGVIDADDDLISGERPEVDLIRLVLSPPVPDRGGQVVLTLTKGGAASDELRLWRSASKGQRVDERRFATAELPLTLWLEGTAPSRALRDVEVRLDYPPGRCQDVAKATFIWIDEVVALHDRGDDVLARFPDLTAPPKEELRATSGGTVGLQPIEDRAFRAASADFFGLLDGEEALRNAIRNGVEDRLSARSALGVIVFRFTVQPPGLGAEKDVFFDVTRQADRIRYDVYTSDAVRAVDERLAGVNDGPFTFTRRRLPLPPGAGETAIELPNDELNQLPESPAPTAQNHLFSASSPGIVQFFLLRIPHDEVYVSNFYEYVRVAFGFRPAGERLLGSRVSPKVKWFARHNVTVAADGSWQRTINRVPTTDPLQETNTNEIGLGHIVLPRGFPRAP